MRFSAVAITGGLLALAGAGPLAAQQDDLVRASDPAGMMSALAGAGYDAELTTDRTGDPMINVELAGINSQILFYGCDAETHENCDSIQFSAGFDREDGWSADEAIKLSTKYRYMSIRLDDENDPYIQWDVEIGDGIPRSVFLRSVLRFSESLDTAYEIVFPK